MPREQDVAALAVLAEPQRRRVFDQLQADAPVTVPQLSKALGMGRTLVEFHLGKLLEAGFVEPAPPDRGSGVRGRPAARYRVSRREVVATVPDRRYELLAGVLLDSLAGHRKGETAAASAARAAHARGAQLGRSLRGRAVRTAAGRRARLERLLVDLGYRPRRSGDVLVVRNCPFDRFRADAAEHVCALNLALSRGYLEGLDLRDELEARLDPSPETCCVVFAEPG